MNISSSSFGKTPKGDDASLWTITNSSGLAVGLTDWGATIVSVMQPDSKGEKANVVLGFEDASLYTPVEGYLGATCGRFANRIALGRFILDGNEYSLACNDGSNHLHGGDDGFNTKLWDAEPYSEGEKSGVVFSYTSPAGEEGYPGKLEVSADYGLDESGRLYMDFKATTDAPTVVNLTNHAYWNLAGSGQVLDQELKLESSSYLVVDDGAIPTGEIRNVAGGPFDFRSAKSIGRDIAGAGGFDHCMIVDGPKGELNLAAEATDPVSGRSLALYTDRAGVQFYSGNFLDGRHFPKHGGFCLEPQDYPDAPNRKEFPSTELRPGEVYHHRSVVEFSAK